MLSKKKCIPCSSGTIPLKGKKLEELHKELGVNWAVVEERYLEREFSFKNFREALAFVNKVGAIAEQEGHHPDLFVSWGKVKVQLSTHKINGLSENDFIFAAKCDGIFVKDS